MAGHLLYKEYLGAYEGVGAFHLVGNNGAWALAPELVLARETVVRECGTSLLSH